MPPWAREEALTFLPCSQVDTLSVDHTFGGNRQVVTASVTVTAIAARHVRARRKGVTTGISRC